MTCCCRGELDLDVDLAFERPVAAPARSRRQPTPEPAASPAPSAYEPPSDAALHKLLSKVGGTLSSAVSRRKLDWSNSRLDAADALVLAHVVAVSPGLQVVNAAAAPAHMQLGSLAVHQHLHLWLGSTRQLVLSLA